MEAKSSDQRVEQVNVSNEEKGPWVSPEVLAARAGEKVEFGKDLVDRDEAEED